MGDFVDLTGSLSLGHFFHLFIGKIAAKAQEDFSRLCGDQVQCFGHRNNHYVEGDHLGGTITVTTDWKKENAALSDRGG